MSNEPPAKSELPANHPVVPVIRYAPLSEIKVYEVTEEELNQLASGFPESPLLSFGLALLATASTLKVALQTAVAPSSNIHENYVAAFWVSLVLGLALLVGWGYSYTSSRKMLREIKKRMPPPPGIQQKE